MEVPQVLRWKIAGSRKEIQHRSDTLRKTIALLVPVSLHRSFVRNTYSNKCSPFVYKYKKDDWRYTEKDIEMLSRSLSSLTR